MSYTKAELEEKLHDTRDQLKEQEKENEQLKAENSDLKEDNLRLREENARLSALVDELNNCNEGLRARLKVNEVEREAAELEARSAALADEADSLVRSLPVARAKSIQAFTARIERKRAERMVKEAIAEPNEPELNSNEPIPEPEKAEVKELPVSTDLGAEKIIEITPNKEVVFEAEMDEVEEDRKSIYHPYGEKKPSRVSRPSESRAKRGIIGRLSQLTEGELDDD